MRIISVLKDEMVEGQRKAQGRKVHKKVVFAADNYNLILGQTSGNAPMQGYGYFASLQHLASRLHELDVDKEEARQVIQRDLFKIFGKKIKKPLTFEEMNEMFDMSVHMRLETNEFYKTVKAANELPKG